MDIQGIDASFDSFFVYFTGAGSARHTNSMMPSQAYGQGGAPEAEGSGIFAKQTLFDGTSRGATKLIKAGVDYSYPTFICKVLESTYFRPEMLNTQGFNVSRTCHVTNPDYGAPTGASSPLQNTLAYYCNTGAGTNARASCGAALGLWGVKRWNWLN